MEMVQTQNLSTIRLELTRTVGIIRTMVAEMVPQKELQPRAFSVMPLVWSLGSVLGPMFGGFFAQPAEQWPSVFGNIEYFKRFPYALPNLIATVFFLLSLASATFFLQETLASKKEKKDWGLLVGQRLTRAFRRRGSHPEASHRRSSFMDGEATAPLLPSKALPAKKVYPESAAASAKDVFTYQTSINLLSYTFLAFHSVAYDQNITVFLNYPVMERNSDNTKLPFYFNGGFGLSSGQIGTIFTIYGITCGLIQFIIYPPLVTRYGVLRCYRICCKCLSQDLVRPANIYRHGPPIRLPSHTLYLSLPDPRNPLRSHHGSDAVQGI